MSPVLTAEDDQLSKVFAALASPVRRSILAHLAEDNGATVNELAAPFDLQLPAVSKHLKVLEAAGLIVRARHARFRPCAIDTSPIRDVLAWAEGYRPVWEARLDRMEAHLANLRSQEISDA